MKPRENVQPLRSAEEIQQFRQALQMSQTAARDVLMFDIGINTGLRISDLLPLKVGDVRGKTSVTLREKKTGKKRTVFLHMIMPEIATYTERKEEEAYLFASHGLANQPSYWDVRILARILCEKPSVITIISKRKILRHC